MKRKSCYYCPHSEVISDVTTKFSSMWCKQLKQIVGAGGYCKEATKPRNYKLKGE